MALALIFLVRVKLASEKLLPMASPPLPFPPWLSASIISVSLKVALVKVAPVALPPRAGAGFGSGAGASHPRESAATIRIISLNDED